MKRTITATLIALALSANAPGQTLPEDISPDTPPIHYDLPVPEVRFNDRAVMFQASLYPDFYRTHSVRRDMRWVREQDTALMNFWDTRGDSVLWLLTQYSGLDWVEDKFDLFVLRYYPSFGGADPLVIPGDSDRRYAPGTTGDCRARRVTPAIQRDLSVGRVPRRLGSFLLRVPHPLAVGVDSASRLRSEYTGSTQR